MHRFLVVAVLALFTLTACSADNKVEKLSDLTHVHNVVAIDEKIFVGSHEGLFIRNEDASWSRVGAAFDVMALSEVDGRLLASGHPGEEIDLPDPIGLIASDDEGRTWAPLSLTGVVDFHLLEASGTTVIGVAANYQALILSNDSGLNWETLDTVPFSDIAIDPQNSKAIALATEGGLQLSSNIGESFTVTETAVSPTLLDWSRGGLFGATRNAIWKWNEDLSEWELVRDGFSEIRAIAVSPSGITVLDEDTLISVPL